MAADDDASRPGDDDARRAGFPSRARVALAGAGAVLTAGMLATAVIASLPASDATRVTDWSARVAACPTPDQPIGNDLSCVSVAWVDAYQGSDLPTLYAALEKQVATSPDRVFDCHNAGHAAGKAILADEPIERVLQATLDSPDPCLGGFGHGALDAFGAVPRDAAEIRTVARMCLASGDMRDSCADGMGHAAWESTRHDAGQASSWCAELSRMPVTAGACIQGIVMQALKTSDGNPPDVNPSEAETGITSLCDSMQAAGTPGSLSNWCYSETANAFAQQVAEDTGRWATAGIGSPARSRVRELWAHAITRCTALGSHEEGCRSRLAELVMTTTYGLNGPTRDLCTVFDEPADQAKCTEYATE